MSRELIEHWRDKDRRAYWYADSISMPNCNVKLCFEDEWGKVAVMFAHVSINDLEPLNLWAWFRNHKVDTHYIRSMYTCRS